MAHVMYFFLMDGVLIGEGAIESSPKYSMASFSHSVTKRHQSEVWVQEIIV